MSKNKLYVLIIGLLISTFSMAQEPGGFYTTNDSKVTTLNSDCPESETITYKASNPEGVTDSDSILFSIVDPNLDDLQSIVDNSLNYYRKLKQNNQIPAYELVVVPTVNWASNHSTKVQWNFEAGYVENNKIYIVEPHTTEQLEVFPTIEHAIRYTVAKEMLIKYCATNAPEWFQYAYASYEAQLDRPYETIRAIYAANNAFPDLSDFDTFDPENNKQQRDLAFTMGEYCILILGDYPKFPSFDINGITISTGNQTKANGFWHLFLEKHYLESAEQVKILIKNKKIAIYGASKDVANAQQYLDTLTTQLKFYEDSLKVVTTRRINVLINPDRCTQLLVEGYECSENKGGGGHGNGMAGCSFISPSFANYSDFFGLMKHEFTHVYQFWMKSNFMPAWLSEGFASCLPSAKYIDPFVTIKDDIFNKWTITTQNLGRYPTIAEMMDYNFVRTNNIDYYGMGWLMVYYIIEKGGYSSLRAVIENNGQVFSSMGYNSKEEFMEYFYHYFDIRIMEKEIVSLTSPVVDTNYFSSTINFEWTALNSNIPLNLEISTNGGSEWTYLLNNTNLSNFTWNVPTNFYGAFYLKFSALSMPNLKTIYGPYQKVNADELTLLSPIGGEFLISGNTKNIQWGYTNIATINIEYSNDNGLNWIEIVSDISASSGNYNWVIPNENSNQCLIKISDTANLAVFDVSDNMFEIHPSNNAGGPYLTDSNTVLLMHFDGNLTNNSALSNDGVPHGNAMSYSSNTVSNLGQSLRIDNSDASSKNYISVAHNENLSLSESWTIEAWVYFSSLSSNSLNSTILSKSTNTNNYFLWYHSSWGSMKGQFTNSSENTMYVAIGNNTITTGKWYHITYIRDNAQHRHKLIIRDENKEILAENSYEYGASKSAVITNTNDLLIGSLALIDGFYFDGYIDELRISNVVRSFETLGIKENIFKDKYKMYPNPTKNNLNINLPKKVDVSIYTVTGQKVLEKKNIKEGIIDISKLKSGLYIVLFNGEKGTLSKKLIIE